MSELLTFDNVMLLVLILLLCVSFFKRDVTVYATIILWQYVAPYVYPRGGHLLSMASLILAIFIFCMCRRRNSLT